MRDPTGRPYYLNQYTNTTQWDRPTQPATPAAPPPPVQYAPPPPAAGAPLPPGWEERRDAQGRVYYVTPRSAPHALRRGPLAGTDAPRRRARGAAKPQQPDHKLDPPGVSAPRLVRVRAADQGCSVPPLVRRAGALRRN